MLTDTKIRNAKRREKPYKLADGAGLSLLVKPNGSKLWRFRYVYGGRENMLALGRYPEVKLAFARDKAHECRTLLAKGTDPSGERRVQKAAQADSFGAIAEEWLRKQPFSDSTRKKAEWLLSLVEPLKRRPVRDIQPADLLRELRRLEAHGKLETAHRVKQRVSQVYRYTVATGRADHDIAASLRGALAPVITENRAALTKPRSAHCPGPSTRTKGNQPSSMRSSSRRSCLFGGELRGAEWAEFSLDGDNPEWRIPAERMKMKTAHVVPLAGQAVTVLDALKAHTGEGKFLFPSLRTADRCISENTLNAALRRLGYSKTEQTAHGFRTIASTLLNELGFHPDVIELQLAHKPRDKVRAAYNHAERLIVRRQMMQSWADYLDGLKSGASVTAIGARTETADAG